MPDDENCSPATKRTPWNKGKLIGARPPLRPKHVWSIRTRLLLEGRVTSEPCSSCWATLRSKAPSDTSALRSMMIESTVRYLGIEVDDALAIAEQVDV
jgi:hypothetical protein